MKILNWIAFIFFFSASFSFAQKSDLRLNTINDYKIGIDYKNERYLVLTFDHKQYYQRKFNSATWDSIPYKFNEIGKQPNFRYNFFHVKDKNFLVSEGCGLVYELRNDSIIRIDRSFEHRNQFNSAPFVYKDEIYYWGGTGLFTIKNILTKYSFVTGEWEKIKYNSAKIPSPRFYSIPLLIKDDLYIISGFSQDETTDAAFGVDYKNHDIWKLNLLDKKWTFLGEIKDKNIMGHLAESPNLINTPKGIFIITEYLHKIDLDKNQVTYFEKIEKYFLSRNERYNYKKDEIIYALKKSDPDLYPTIKIEAFEDYIGEIDKTDTFLEKNNYLYFIFGSLFLFIPLTYFYFIKKQKKKPLIEEKTRYISYKNENIFFDEKVINSFTKEEKGLLIYFFKNYKKPIAITEVVEFVSNNDDNVNYNSLTKRKDQILNGIKQKAAFILEADEKDIFIYQKNELDKRIRELYLNPKYFKLND